MSGSQYADLEKLNLPNEDQTSPRDGDNSTKSPRSPRKHTKGSLKRSRSSYLGFRWTAPSPAAGVDGTRGRQLEMRIGKKVIRFHRAEKSSDYWHDLSGDGKTEKHVRSWNDFKHADTCGKKVCGCCRFCGWKCWSKGQTFILICLIGACTSCFALTTNILGTAMQQAVSLIPDLPGQLAPHWNTTTANIVGDVCYALMCMALVMVAVLLVRYASPYAAGSGIPKMKSVFSGVQTHLFLSVRTLIAKATGLAFCYSSSIYIGREGPLVHISCCVAVILMRLPCFQRYRNNNAQNHSMLAVSVAAGVVAAFGAPFGGVIFAIEIVSSYFLVSNLPRMFNAAVVGTLVCYPATMLFQEFLPKEIAADRSLALFKTQFDELMPNFAIYVLSGLLGAICGLVAGLFNRAVELSVRMQRALGRLGSRIREESYGHFAMRAAPVVLFATSLCTCLDIALKPTFPLITNPESFIDTCLFSNHFHLKDDDITRETDTCNGYAATSDNRWAFFVYTLGRFILTAACVSLPIPAGLFAPVFLLGAMIGRLYFCYVASYLHPWLIELNPIFGNADGSEYVEADDIGYRGGEYAVIGAAALAGGVTRAVSTAVIALELTGQHTILLPMGIAVLAAYYVANRVAPAVYDVMTLAHNLPHLGDLPSHVRNIPARAVGKVDLASAYVTEYSTVKDVYHLLQENQDMDFFPVVVEYQRVKSETTHPETPSPQPDKMNEGMSRPLLTASGRHILRNNYDGSAHREKKSGPRLLLVGEVTKRVLQNTVESAARLERKAGRARRLASNTSSTVAELENVLERDEESTSDDDSSVFSDADEEVELAAHGFGKYSICLTAEAAERMDHPHFVSRKEAELHCKNNPNCLPVIVDASPFSVLCTTPLSKVHMLFNMLRLSHVFVVDGGYLQGVIRRRDMLTLHRAEGATPTAKIADCLIKMCRICTCQSSPPRSRDRVSISSRESRLLTFGHEESDSVFLLDSKIPDRRLRMTSFDEHTPQRIVIN